MRVILASASGRASPVSELVIGGFLIVFGVILATDLRNISSTMLRNSSGFTTWGRRRGQWRGPNPFRLLGLIFAVVGVIAVILGLAR